MVGSRRTPSVDDLNGTEALAILRQLWNEGGEFREAVRDRIEALLAEVDPDGVADAVFADLDGIAVEELWDRSGPSPFGYTEPTEETWEMIRETLTPYLRGLERYLKLGKLEESMLYCAGLLEGIYAFGTESDTEFRDWAPDDPEHAFRWVLDKWKKGVTDRTLRERMAQELGERCPKWPGVRL